MRKFTFLVLLTWAAPAGAQVTAVRDEITAAETMSPRSNLEGLVMAPGMWELGTEMAFVTADATPGGGGLKLTDVALFRPRLRFALGERLTLDGAFELLAKQPDAGAEDLFQGATIDARVGLAPWLALQAGADLGPLVGAGGWHAGWSLSAIGRHEAGGHFLRFQWGLGLAGTHVDIDGLGAATGGEVRASGEAVFYMPEMAGWMGVRYAVPFATGRSGFDYDPQVRTSLELGGVVSPHGSQWSLYVVLDVIDRGDLAKPMTTLPVLDGGFDQIQVVLGLSHRFGGEPRASLVIPE